MSSSKQQQRNTKALLKELPFYNFTGSLALYHGKFNNLLSSELPTKRNLESLTGLYDLDLFALNTNLDTTLNANNNLFNQQIHSRYFSPYNFKQYGKSLTNEQKESSLSIFHINIASLNRNLEKLVTHYLEEIDFHFDIIGISETKITNSNQNLCTSKIPGYAFEHVPTPLASGGAGLFIDETLNYTVLEKRSNEAYQALWIEISFEKQKNVICGIIYRQHNSPDHFLEYFNETIEKLTSTGKTVYLLGDFNLCLLKTETSQYSQDFLLALQTCYLLPTIDKPTRVHKTSASLIDNIFVTDPEKVLISGNIITDVSDHFSQFCILTSARDKLTKKIIRKRDFSHFSSVQFNKDLSEVDWHDIVVSKANNIDDQFSSFYRQMNKAVNKNAPIKIISARKRKQLAKPWITKGIRTSIKIKNKLYESGSDSKYKYYRNKIASLTRLSKKQYFFDFFNENMKNMRKTWQGINELLNSRKRNHRVRALKDPYNNNKVTNKPSRISNILNEHFASVGNKLASKLSPRSNHMDYLSKSRSPDSSFFFKPITPDDVKQEILSLSNNKSHGLYSCPAQLLKYSCDIISPVLSEIFNTSIMLGVYPSKLKISKITPVFKSEDETDASNYRPISLLSNFNRIFEKLMYYRMIDFIDKNDIIYSKQYGFRKAHSTQHAILDIVETIQTNMNNRLFSCGVFIDLKKAFDTVNHKILLDKINYYGFRGIIHEWFQSYLTNRTQTTQIGSHISTKLTAPCGVPQGSVLGPLLFLLYVNDIHHCSNKLNFFLFADDTNLLYADKNLKSLEQTVNTELYNLYDWLTTNKLTLNIKKSNFVIFRPRQKTINYRPKISIFDSETNSNVNLECKNYIKYLGVFIDENLSWKNHIDSVITKISKTIGIIAKLRHFVPSSVLLNIYTSLITPYLTYGLITWGNASKTYLNKIIVLQKRVLRLIYFADRKEHAIPLFVNAKILPVTFLYYEAVCNLMFDIHDNSAPTNIMRLFTRTSSIHTYATRSSTSQHFYVKNSRLNILKKAFSRVGVKTWNEIPHDLKTLSKKPFKKEIKKALLEILKTEDSYVEMNEIAMKLKHYKINKI